MRIQTFNYDVNLLESILWQYNESTNLISLLTQKQEWYDLNQSEFWSNWYSNVFDLLTANLFGLSVWSIILNVPLYVNAFPEPSDAPIWGFNAGTFGSYENSYVNFNNGNFSTSGLPVELTLEEQRFILRLKYWKLVSRGAVANPITIGLPDSGYFEDNEFFNYLTYTSNIVPNGQFWVLDGFNMTIRYIFNFAISQSLQTVLIDQDLLPRPAGVGIERYYVNNAIFGFNSGTFDNYENNYVNFNNGCFFSGSF